MDSNECKRLEDLIRREIGSLRSNIRDMESCADHGASVEAMAQNVSACAIRIAALSGRLRQAQGRD